MEKITRIYEGYFNNVDSNNDEIVKEIEDSVMHNADLKMHIIIYLYYPAYLKWIMKKLDIDNDCKTIINTINSLDCIDNCSIEIKLVPFILEQVLVLLIKKFQETKTFTVNNTDDLSNKLKELIKNCHDICFDKNGEITDEFMSTEIRYAVDIIVTPLFDCSVSYKQFSNDMHKMFNILNKTSKDCENQYGQKSTGLIILQDTEKPRRKQELWMTTHIAPNELCQTYEMITGKDSTDVERSLHYEDEYSLAKEHKWLDKIGK